MRTAGMGSREEHTEPMSMRLAEPQSLRPEPNPHIVSAALQDRLQQDLDEWTNGDPPSLMLWGDDG